MGTLYWKNIKFRKKQIWPLARGLGTRREGGKDRKGKMIKEEEIKRKSLMVNMEKTV